MTPELLEQAAELTRRREPFVLATVVWRRGPSSGKPGAAALVLPDGSVRGWLGGACAEPTVIRESLAALASGEPLLLALGEADEARAPPGARSVPMACASEGALEVYLEPMLPPPHVVVIGRSPAAGTLASL
ncbi:MAG TPA: XdhC family protein, partial [Acidimicrobiales bacterium]|nr:XdhC family protein [Acidimicrobiales bacterium]